MAHTGAAGHGAASAQRSPPSLQTLSKSSSRRFPVTVSVFRSCAAGSAPTVAHRPGNAKEVLTGHYRHTHPETPGILPFTRAPHHTYRTVLIRLSETVRSGQPCSDIRKRIQHAR